MSNSNAPVTEPYQKGEAPQDAENSIATESSSKSDTNNNTDKEYLVGVKLYAFLGSITLICFLFLMDHSILGTAIPQITSEFHSLSDVGWYIGTYQLASASLQPLTGKLYTYFHNKNLYLLSFFIFEIGSLVCGVARNSATLIIGRTIAGVGSSGLMNGALTMMAGATPIEKRPLYMGIMMGVSQMGIVVGPLVSGAFTEHVTWRWCFYINLPLGAVAAALLFLLSIPETPPKPAFSFARVRQVIPDLDLIGFVLFVPSSVMFLLALQLGSEEKHSWNSAVIIGLFCGSGVMSIFFILWERRMGDRAMLPGSMLQKRVVWTSCVFVLCMMSCNLVASNWLPTYFQAVKGVKPAMSGVYILPSILSQLLLAVISGIGVSKLGYYLPWAIASAVVSSIGNGLVSTFSPSTDTGKWIGYQIVMGAGRGAGMQMPLVAVQNTLPPSAIPVSMAFLIFFQTFGSAVTIVISTTIFTQTLSRLISEYAPSVSVEAALAAGGGASAVRELVPQENGQELNGLLRAYSGSLRDVFLFLVGLSGLMLLVSFGMGWKDVRQKDGEKGKQQSEDGEKGLQNETVKEPTQ